MEETVFHWTETKEGEACILEGYGASPFVVVPEETGGLPVAGLGDYCFSDAAGSGGDRVDSPDMRRLSGEFLQVVSLPDSMRKIGNLAFYNCTGLRELSIGPALTEFGSDAFMNCLRLETIRIRCSVTEQSGLKQLLSQRTSDTKVVFEKGGRTEAVLYFPEYYEEYDEVGPAHIFALNLTGEGFRARQCFRQGIVDLAQYDGIFGQACAEESPETLCRMAVNRLCYPAGLSPGAEERYRCFLRQQEGILVRDLVKTHSLELLEILFRKDVLTEEGKNQCIRLASGKDWPEGAAALLRLCHGTPGFGEKDRYSFD